MEDSNLSLVPGVKKLRFSTDFTKCLKCQQTLPAKLSCASNDGLQTFWSAAKIRNDEVYIRLLPDMSSISSSQQTCVWHQNCYKSYTSKTNLEAVKKRLGSTSTASVSSEIPETSGRFTRSTTSPANLDLCIICQLPKHKGDPKLCQVSTLDGAKTMQRAMQIRYEYEADDVLRRVAGIDLVAANIKYHPKCRANYTSEVNLQRLTNTSETDSIYEVSFNELIREINFKLLHVKHAYDMGYLISRYKDILLKKGADHGQAETYRTEKLKRRLMKEYNEEITFQEQYDRSKPELVYSSDISIQDVINTVSMMKNDAHTSDVVRQSDDDTASAEHSQTTDIIHAAQILSKDLKVCQGINVNPLSTRDINDETAFNMIPNSVYLLLKLVIEGTDPELPLDLDTKSKSTNETTHRHIMSVAQDLIHMTSKARKRTPKHIGLAMATKHLTGSKHLVKLLNHAGHCVSYDEVQRIDTGMAEYILQQSEDGKIIPSNIRVGPFVHAAADNVDINEETLDGRSTTHATSMVLYQSDHNIESNETTDENVPEQKPRKRSMDTRPDYHRVLNYNPHGPRPQPVFPQDVNNDWFKLDLNPLASTQASNLDFAWLLLRLAPDDISDVTLKDPVNQTIPSWTGFNVAISENPHTTTTIGYCPLLPVTPTEYSTVYTVLKNTQGIMEKLHQNNCVLTFDEALYAKAKEIQWRNNEELTNIVLRMGGFHICLNLLSIIGRYAQESGIEDVLIESNVYGSSTVAKIIRGKIYNRSVRAHKLMYDALFRLKWMAFVDWLQQINRFEEFDDTILEVLQDTITAFQNTEGMNELSGQVALLCERIVPLNHLMHEFETHGCTVSATFAFWNGYTNLVSILLRYIRSERTGNWELHLSTVTEMLPIMFAFDHINYARWVLAYLSDMNLLPETAPEVHQQFLHGHHAIKRSNSSFSQIWSDMGLEQTVNRHCKTQGGVIGFSTRANAVDRWFITAHERAAITNAMDSMLGAETLTQKKKHKDSGKARLHRDESDVQNIIRVISDNMHNPFTTGVGENDTEPLTNIATGRIAPQNVTNDLMECLKTGKTLMDDFVSKRLMTNEIKFFDPIHKVKLKTFASMKKTAASVVDGKRVQVATDRDFFSRLIVVSKQRDINLEDVLRHELCAVPLALAKMDGTPNKTDKSKMIANLEDGAGVVPDLPESDEACCWIIDGMALIRMSGRGAASTFGQYADHLLHIIGSISNKQHVTRVDITFDRYDNPHSIKTQERERRTGDFAMEVKIHGPNTTLPKQWDRYLSSSKNKLELTDFLSKSFLENAQASLKVGCEFIVSGGLKDSHAAMGFRNGNTYLVPSLVSSHEEADVKMILHAVHASHVYNEIVVWSPDTDVALLCIHFYDQINKALWLRMGTKDRTRYIPIHNIATLLGPDLAKFILPIHGLSGCDTVSAFSSQGKVKLWQMVKNEPDRYRGILEIGKSEALDENTISSAEQLVVNLYKRQSDGDVQNINNLRHKQFCRAVASEKLPPTQDALRQHLHRVNFQVFIWLKATTAMPDIPSPVGHGWELEDDKLQPVWMTQSAAPDSLVQLVKCGCKTGCTKNCRCKKESLACTGTCDCAGEDLCQNPFKHSGDDDDDDTTDEDDDENT